MKQIQSHRLCNETLPAEVFVLYLISGTISLEVIITQIIRWVCLWFLWIPITYWSVPLSVGPKHILHPTCVHNLYNCKLSPYEAFYDLLRLVIYHQSIYLQCIFVHVCFPHKVVDSWRGNNVMRELSNRGNV